MHNELLPSNESILAMIQGELTSKRRWLYRWILLIDSIVLAVIVSLWMTEPKPLPSRLHVTFGLMTGIAIGWICVLSWILTRKNCPTAIDRLATAWMATIGSCLFLATGLWVSMLRRDVTSAAWLGLTGGVMAIASVLILRRAYGLRTSLQAKLAELKR